MVSVHQRKSSKVQNPAVRQTRNIEADEKKLLKMQYAVQACRHISFNPWFAITSKVIIKSQH